MSRCRSTPRLLAACPAPPAAAAPPACRGSCGRRHGSAAAPRPAGARPRRRRRPGPGRPTVRPGRPCPAPRRRSPVRSSRNTPQLRARPQRASRCHATTAPGGPCFPIPNPTRIRATFFRNRRVFYPPPSRPRAARPGRRPTGGRPSAAKRRGPGRLGERQAGEIAELAPARAASGRPRSSGRGPRPGPAGLRGLPGRPARSGRGPARARSPPCLRLCLRRAFSTRMRRMASAAAAKKWPRLSQCGSSLRADQAQVGLVDQGGGAGASGRASRGPASGRRAGAARRRPAAAAGSAACGSPCSMADRIWVTSLMGLYFTPRRKHRNRGEKGEKRVPCSNGMNRNLRTVYATVQQRLEKRVEESRQTGRSEPCPAWTVVVPVNLASPGSDAIRLCLIKGSDPLQSRGQTP